MTVSENSKQFNINPNCRELIEKGECQADCCGVVPFEYHTFLQIKSKVQVKDYEIQKFKQNGIQFCVLMPKDFKCVFLNRDNLSCSIYNSPRKPEVCRKFGMSTSDPLLCCTKINKDKEKMIEANADKILQHIKNRV